ALERAEKGEKPKVALDAVPGLETLVGPTPRGRAAAALLGRGTASSADLKLLRDPSAVARAARALYLGDAAVVPLLAELASVDSRAHEALVAAVSSSTDPSIRAVATRALEGETTRRSQR